METIYTDNLGQKLFLYNSGSFIYLRKTAGIDISRPILLCNDYATGLYSTIFQNSIYFVYQNLQGDLILRNVMEPNILYQLSSEESPDYVNPILLCFCDILVLLYYVNNPLDNSYLLRMCCPLTGKEIATDIPSFSDIPQCQTIHFEDKLLFSFTANGITTFYCLNSVLQFSYIQLFTSPDLQKLIDTNTLPHKEQSEKYEHKIKEQETIISSIKLQYDDLMNTAIQYREEAKKWYNKCHIHK